MSPDSSLCDAILDNVSPRADGSYYASGFDNILPTTRTVSSFQVLDQVITWFNATYPNLNEIVIAGHSLGGQATQCVPPASPPACPSPPPSTQTIRVRRTSARHQRFALLRLPLTPHQPHPQRSSYTGPPTPPPTSGTPPRAPPPRPPRPPRAPRSTTGASASPTTRSRTRARSSTRAAPRATPSTTTASLRASRRATSSSPTA